MAINKMQASKVIFTAILLSLLAACGNNTTEQQSSSHSSPATPVSSPVSSTSANASNAVTKIDIKEKEMDIIPSSNTAPAGQINFVIKNVGRMPHELVVFKTDLPIDKLPQKNGEMDEKGAGVKNVADTGENYLKSGETRTLRANLSPGNYVLVCNLPGHFSAGMKTAFVVK
jgi:uncharacterized cupredoxin-like copper-binding protein